ncbi:hypothetical protein VP1G_01109 [Cytospora mali]|uniref:Uncharacterized protein n=1 Tax=Cytospora mali TaxID=578113 RepID=A0A194UPX0_CYTMA|nr:hypothetical protein VP1G_01109 [Valsa mali var. pyri (nom. inval.)]
MAQSRGSSRRSRGPSVEIPEDESLPPLPCTEEPCWDEGGLCEDIVKEHVYRVNTNPEESDVTFIPKDEQCGIWHSPPNAKCHASFGDQGTTATVGAFGQLVQFSDYLGAGTSGMFSADHPRTAEPYLVRDRMADLQNLAQEPFQFSSGVYLNRPFGLEFPGLKLKPDMLPVLKWREVLRRFTTENDARKRLLAVTRSPRATRFLFHARDTALFYGLDDDLFIQDTSIHKLWTNTIESQSYHEENQETWWDSAMRYALSIVIGCRERRINDRTPDELVRTAIETLFRISSPNGFVPRQLDMTTKEPLEDIIYEESDRDSHYHTNFEIQYVLLTHANKINDVIDRSQKVGSPVTSETLHAEAISRPGRPVLGSPLTQPDTQQETIQWLDAEKILDYLSSQVAGQPELTRRIPDERRLAMKKVIPFNSLIDSSNIVKLEDEWMFDYPQFLSREQPIIIDEVFKCLDAFHPSLMERLDAKKVGRQYSFAGLPDIVATEMEYRVFPEADEKFSIQDVPQQKRLEGKRRKNSHTTLWLKDNLALWKGLSSPRTAKLAKKRLIHVFDADPETAFICVAASPGYVQSKMARFFERHSRYEKHIFDECTMVHNTWETEVQLSFYRLLDTTLWQEFDHLLQALEQDLASTLAKVKIWESREAERGEEKPRWTQNDERKYRTAINKLQFNLRSEIDQVGKVHDDIKSLRELYTRRLKDTREELSSRSNQNITSFTYVTIVFLPLGFAASVFSMNGSLSGSLIISMVTCAVGALAVTVFALINARIMASVGEDVAEVIQDFTKAVQRFTEMAMRTSIIAQKEKLRHDQEENKQVAWSANESSGKIPRVGEYEQRRLSTMSFLSFWLAYLFLEVPARRIVLACRILSGVPQLYADIFAGAAQSPEISDHKESSWKPILHSGKNIMRVIGGFVILPIFLISWVCQLLLYNIMDIFVLIGGLTQRNLYELLGPASFVKGRHLDYLTKLSIRLRPVKQLDDKLRKPSVQHENQPQKAHQSNEKLEGIGGEEENEMETVVNGKSEV